MIDVNVVNPFLTACENAFKSMFSLNPQHKAPYLVDVIAGHPWEISGIVGLTGDYTGVVAFRLHKILADKMLQNSNVTIGSEDNKDEIVSELVSEFTNIISGNAISAIKEKNINISPPVVISGKGHMISWPKNYPVVAIPFITEHGTFEVDVCFK